MSGPSRRQLLLGGGAATALVAVAAVGIQLRPGAERTPRTPLRSLDARTFAVVAAVADRVCPNVEGLPTAWDVRVPERVDELLDALHPGQAEDVKKALMLLESPLASVLFGGPPTPFTLQSPERQDRTLAAWRDSRWSLRRTVWQAVTGLVKGPYWSSPETFAHVGYQRPAWATQ